MKNQEYWIARKIYQMMQLEKNCDFYNQRIHKKIASEKAANMTGYIIEAAVNIGVKNKNYEYK